jgi:hypothetical protein
MSYTYLLEQGEESSAASFSDIPQCVLSRLNLIARKSCCKGSGMESFQSSQSGMMSPPSTELRGEGKSMSSAEDSLAKTFQSQGGGLELKENEADSGQKWPESLAKYDRNSRSWRTAQCLLFEDLGECLETFPKWGMMRNGGLWERITFPLLTKEKESGYWLTPTCLNISPTETRRGKREEYRKSIGRKDVPGGLAEQVVTPKFWPTPCARDWKGSNTPEALTRQDGKSRMDQLPNAVAYGGDQTPQIGQLNPDWVEWLMGWPIGQSDLKPLEMDKFRLWLQQHGEFLEGISND